MGVQTLAQALEREHREIDEGIEAFTSGLVVGKVDPGPLVEAVSALRRHIYLEEAFLFPPLREAGMVMPVLVMEREHGEMWALLDQLDAEVAADPASERVASLCSTLVPRLASHNVKEETILYPPADTMLGEPERAHLGEFIDSGRMPPGWVCAGARE